MTGIILAGGKNSRIKTDKAFLPIGGKLVVEHIIDKLKNIFSEILIVTNNYEPYFPVQKKYADVRIGLTSDVVLDKGSIGGLYSGISASNSEYNFVVACDMPFINGNIIKHMMKYTKGHDAVIPEFNGMLHPLFGIYSKCAAGVFEKAINADNLKIQDALKSLKLLKIEQQDIMRFDPEGSSFINLNTKDEYLNYRKGLREYEKAVNC